VRCRPTDAVRESFSSPDELGMADRSQCVLIMERKVKIRWKGRVAKWERISERNLE